jgi:superfamily I DNA/RNA helicase
MVIKATFQNRFLFVRKHPVIKLDPQFLKNEYEKVILQKHITSFESYKNVLRSGMGSQLLSIDREKVWEAIEKYESYQTYTKTYTFEEIIFKLNRYLELWPEYIPFSYVVCDELQDLNNIELRLLRNLVEKKENDLFLVGDPFQNIYQKQVNFKQSNVQIVGRSHSLKINYRTTEEIRKFANNALHNFVFEDFNGDVAENITEKSLINGTEPSYLSFENVDEQLEFIEKYIKESFGQIGLHELCVVARTSDQVDEVYEYLKSIKLPVVKLSELQNLDLANDKVVVATMHGVKGLEFKNVIVYGIDKKSFLKKPRGFKNWSENDQNSFIKSEYALLYVVFSRAISNLILLGLGEKVEF